MHPTTNYEQPAHIPICQRVPVEISVGQSGPWKFAFTSSCARTAATAAAGCPPGIRGRGVITGGGGGKNRVTEFRLPIHKVRVVPKFPFGPKCVPANF